MPESDPDTVQVNQRPLPETDLQSVIANITKGEIRLTVIASEKASYTSLLKVMEATSDKRLDFQVLVRNLVQTKL